MTRAVTIEAPPERVWPWIAQLGRGAGWYSIDWLDNGGKTSAWHLVSWIPEPSLGDATAIGYLRDIDPGQSVTWWLDGGRFVGSRARLVSSFLCCGEGQGTRVISRISADTAGPLALFAMLVFACIDSIMAGRQLVGLRDRVEYCERNPTTVKDSETGDRAQYQLYEICYASGGSAGVRGKEEGGRWREAAIEAGVLPPD
jgi:carbon monoxide dehydrogenase subunit G